MQPTVTKPTAAASQVICTFKFHTIHYNSNSYGIMQKKTPLCFNAHKSSETFSFTKKHRICYSALIKKATVADVVRFIFISETMHKLSAIHTNKFT